MENYKKLRKDIEGNTNEWKDTLCSWLNTVYTQYGWNNIFNMTILPKAIFSAVPTRILMTCSHRTGANNPNFLMETQKIQNSQNSLKKSSQSLKYHDPWFQTILQSYTNQSNMILAQKQTHRSMEENSPEMNPHLNGQFIYNIEGKNIQWGNTASSINSVEKNWTAICKRIRLD